MCNHCIKAADLPDGTSQKKRNKHHAKCIGCTCQHKPHGSWKGH